MPDVYRFASVVTKSDTVPIQAHRALLVTTAGNLVVNTPLGDATLVVTAGQVLPMVVKLVKVASTAAVVALQ
jgi:hypothetical protein